MARLMFVNLPVRDLARSMAFYQAIGATKDERFCDDTAACMALSDTIHVMLATHDKFRQFTPKPIADARRVSEVLLSVSADSRAVVDEVVDKARAAGGTPDPGPLQDHGYVYVRSFEDPDGHIWEAAWIDLEAMMASRPQAAQA